MADRYDDIGRARPASRARGKSRARGAQPSGYSSSRHGSAAGSRNGSSRVGTQHGSSYYGRKPDRNDNGYIVLIGAAVAAFVIIGGLVFILKSGFSGGDSIKEETTVAAETFDPDSIRDDVYLDVSSFAPGAELVNMKGMNREQVKNAIMATYEWNLVVKNTNPSLADYSMPALGETETSAETTGEKTEEVQDNDGSEQTVEVDNPYANITIRPEVESFAVPDLIEANLDEMIDQIFADYESKINQKSETAGTEESTESAADTAVVADYALALPDFSGKVKDYMNQLATVWKMNPKNGDITSYDSSSGEFVFGGSVDGYEINAESTAAKVLKAISDRDYSASIDADGSKISASVASIKDKYEVIGSFTTKTTANSIRNGNIKTAAAAINGTVLQPGEEFSFNETVGQRTEEKGYGGAPAYNEGEVVTEVGGGVCQVSSTLYNAVFRSGLTTTYRRSHTFAPTYVTPGTDATVSWPGPDYKFVNDSDHAIGIRAWYSDQTMNVQIYGIRVLPKGVSWELVSEKAADLPVPDAQLITEGEESEGTAGSEWQAYKIIHNADGTTEKIKDHYTHYSGHTPKKYTPEIAASIEASKAAESLAPESAESSATDESTTGETQEEAEDPDNHSEPEESDEPETEATKAETKSEPVHENPEIPGLEPGDFPINDGLIGEGPL
ncbi:VanW family protein [Oribacterium sp. WCC10]|uniref:VanW family protein n=1 Tax=Oribacterium sp. WCC10 TaxID=1855343 RepID=UPI0008F274D1|nr:VanW family protein [Oribacterium sp. WCC10]SFG07616.1 Vancomycin resistance protein YoaR, contains peptidoglycan-binding and VanW domains [Oribacterium sp. WCC10]